MKESGRKLNNLQRDATNWLALVVGTDGQRPLFLVAIERSAMIKRANTENLVLPIGGYASTYLSQIHEVFAMKSRIHSPWRFAAAPIDASPRRFASMFFALTLAVAAANETHAAAARPLRIAYLLTSGTMAS